MRRQKSFLVCSHKLFVVLPNHNVVAAPLFECIFTHVMTILSRTSSEARQSVFVGPDLFAPVSALHKDKRSGAWVFLGPAYLTIPTMSQRDLATVEGVSAFLHDKHFDGHTITPLTGGFGNFVYRIHLREQYLGRKTVVLKHAKPYLPGARDFAFPLERQVGRKKNHGSEG